MSTAASLYRRHGSAAEYRCSIGVLLLTRTINNLNVNVSGHTKPLTVIRVGKEPSGNTYNREVMGSPYQCCVKFALNMSWCLAFEHAVVCYLSSPSLTLCCFDSQASTCITVSCAFAAIVLSALIRTCVANTHIGCRGKAHSLLKRERSDRILWSSNLNSRTITA